MNDDEHDAWQLHHHGADWEEIGTEMGCSPTTAQTFAAAYEKTHRQRRSPKPKHPVLTHATTVIDRKKQAMIR